MLMANDANFNYPMLAGWDTNDIVKVSALYSAVSEAYESGISRDKLLAVYADFKTVVTSKGEEKQIGKQFEAESHYSIYRTIRTAQQSTRKMIVMEG